MRKSVGEIQNLQRFYNYCQNKSHFVFFYSKLCLEVLVAFNPIKLHQIRHSFEMKLTAFDFINFNFSQRIVVLVDFGLNNEINAEFRLFNTIFAANYCPVRRIIAIRGINYKTALFKLCKHQNIFIAFKLIGKLLASRICPSILSPR